jgi:hypothetical protein
MEPLASAMKYFAEDFKAHIDAKECPYSTENTAALASAGVN